MPNPGDLVPYSPATAIARRTDDIMRQAREDRSARSLAASTIGAGGLTVKDGGSITIEGTGALNTNGAINTTGSISASTTVAAGTNVTAVGQVQGATLRSTGNTTVSGALAVGGDVNVTGNVFIPNRTAVVSGYFGLWVNSDGRIGISSSARRYKQDITPRTYTLDQIALIQIVSYRLRSAVALLGDAARVEVGVVAEELIDAGLSEFVAFNADGTTESVAYERLDLIAIAGVQQLITRVQTIESRLAAAGIA